MKRETRGIWRLAAAALVGALFAVALGAQPAGGPGPGGPGCGPLVASLGLTSDQRTALDTLRQQLGDAIGPIHDQMKTVRDQIDAAAAAGNPDRCAIGDLALQEVGFRGQIDALFAGAEAKIVASLTVAQKAKYDTFVGINPGCAIVRGPLHDIVLDGVAPPPSFARD